MALTPLPFKQDIDLLIEGLQLVAQRQQAEPRQELAVGLLGGAALASRLRRAARISVSATLSASRA
jgi:hypothetical protein